MHVSMLDFKNWCALPSMMGAINGTHIFEIKPSKAFPKYYLYLFFKGYNIVVQSMVDNNKMFIVCDYQITSTIHVCSKNLAYTLYVRLFDMNVGSQDGVPHYMLRDKGHPLLPWLTTPHKEKKHNTILKHL